MHKNKLTTRNIHASGYMLWNRYFFLWQTRSTPKSHVILIPTAIHQKLRQNIRPQFLRARCTSLTKWLTERSCNPPYDTANSQKIGEIYTVFRSKIRIALESESPVDCPLGKFDGNDCIDHFWVTVLTQRVNGQRLELKFRPYGAT